VALKRQQAAEDAVALGLRTIATGNHLKALPPGPIYGMKVDEVEVPAMESVIKEVHNTSCPNLNSNSIRKPSSGKKENGQGRNSNSGNNQGQNPEKERERQQYNSNTRCTMAENPTPKDILKKLFPSYEEGVLDQVLFQNDHSLVKTIQKLTPHHSHRPHSDKEHGGNK
jgi:hypothetical protein